jgi:hypothetical protein
VGLLSGYSPSSAKERAIVFARVYWLIKLLCGFFANGSVEAGLLANQAAVRLFR